MTRREFVSMSAVTGAAILTGAKVFGSTSSPGTASNLNFKIGGDLEVNRLGFGAMRITGEGVWGWPPDRANAVKVLKHAVELGVDLIDTADAYGPETSELLIAEALHPYPKGLIIATKGGLTRPGPGQWVPNGKPDYLKACVDKSLKRLKIDRIDLYQLHRIDSKVPAEDSLGALKEAQQAGKIRHIGLSEVSAEEIERAQKVVPIVSIQNRYNFDDRKWDAAVDYCEKHNLGFLPWAPVGGNHGLGGGAAETVAKAHNASVYQVALAWLLQRSPVMLPIPGTQNLKHLEDNCAAAKLKLSPEEWKSLAA
ncbi:MAG: oxidoreductase [Verrucomicrobia bacterium]|nr:MAG: oxidoreductase [Verrucomicrobiota bacterium]